MNRMNGLNIRTMSDESDVDDAIEDLQEKLDDLESFVEGGEWSEVEGQLDEIESITGGIRAFAQAQAQAQAQK